jgi:hypothetical protein
MSKAAEQNLDPNGRHVLSQSMIHGDVQCVRCLLVLCKMKDRDELCQGQLDFTFGDFDALPEHEPEKGAAAT